VEAQQQVMELTTKTTTSKTQPPLVPLSLVEVSIGGGTQDISPYILPPVGDIATTEDMSMSMNSFPREVYSLTCCYEKPISLLREKKEIIYEHIQKKNEFHEHQEICPKKGPKPLKNPCIRVN
jgi:hypothetical protein